MEEKVYFKNSKGLKLCGILSNPTSSRKKPIMVLCHGFGTSKDRHVYVKLQRFLNNHQISTFRFDFFGHGESEGKLEDITISEAVDDVLHAIQFLRNRNYGKIGLVGSSFGGIAGLISASRTNDLFVLVLKSPLSNYEEKERAVKSNKELKEWRSKGFIYYPKKDGKKLKLNYTFFEDSKKNNGYEAAKKIKIPTLIIHGDKDMTISIGQSQKTSSLIENCKLEVIKGADHSYSNPKHFKKMLDLISKFIIENS